MLYLLFLNTSNSMLHFFLTPEPVALFGVVFTLYFFLNWNVEFFLTLKPVTQYCETYKINGGNIFIHIKSTFYFIIIFYSHIIIFYYFISNFNF
jgi:hypothetical protein